jgi:hypothetical protein
VTKALSVALIREAMAERSAMIRTHALAYIEQHGTAYSREIFDAIVQRPDGVDVRVQHVGAELRALETEGLLDSRLAPATTANGQSMMRRYVRDADGGGVMECDDEDKLSRIRGLAMEQRDRKPLGVGYFDCHEVLEVIATLESACQEWQRKADDHRRQRDDFQLALKSAEDECARSHKRIFALVRERDKLQSTCQAYQQGLQILCGALGCDVSWEAANTAARNLRGAALETVICSAIRLPDGRVFRGHRHGDCIRTAREAVNWNGGVDPWREGDGIGRHEYWSPGMCRDQGFITSRGRYVDRKEGMRLQIAAGIESVAEGGYRAETLFSEDLY